ncbi:adhesion G-protein coupled receptor G4-like [Rhincodon typus]|uniref:adhesion G-protein coupled receptor G4-like n=1 Tax=Rhincodon typus TaxID=259920 RepID=UPI0020307F08|nr:adhesion G-protein coupled receptor G4-like [Rhincodon typus]
MISRGTPHCSSDSWMYSKVHISSAVLFFILVTVHQGTCATLKGQKAVFKLSAPDEYGTLSPGTNIPSLGSFTLCIDIRLRQNNKNRMIAFTYNTDIKRMHSVPHHELGIMIKDRKLVIWLFHKQLTVRKDISFASWHSVCLTWNGNTHETHVYLNRTHVLSKTLNNAYSLGQNGSLVLGRKHSRGADRLRLDREIFVGDLYLFRLWDHAKGLQSIAQQNCEDGNVITWDSQQWDFVGSILKYDPSLCCSKLSVADPKSETTDSSTECDDDWKCEKPEESLPTGSTAHLGSTSSEVTLSSSSTKEISMTPTGTSSPPNMTEISTTPTKISSPPNTTEISTPTEISSPSNTTEINTILTGTSPRMNRTKNSTTPAGTSSPGNTTENSTALTGTSSAANTTGTENGLFVTIQNISKLLLK